MSHNRDIMWQSRERDIRNKIVETVKQVTTSRWPFLQSIPIWACFNVCTSSRRKWARNCGKFFARLKSWDLPNLIVSCSNCSHNLIVSSDRMVIILRVWIVHLDDCLVFNLNWVPRLFHDLEVTTWKAVGVDPSSCTFSWFKSSFKVGNAPKIRFRFWRSSTESWRRRGWQKTHNVAFFFFSEKPIKGLGINL